MTSKINSVPVFTNAQPSGVEKPKAERLDHNAKIAALREAFQIDAEKQFDVVRFPYEIFSKTARADSLDVQFNKPLESINPSMVPKPCMVTLIQNIPALVVKARLGSNVALLYFSEKEKLGEGTIPHDYLTSPVPEGCTKWHGSYVTWKKNTDWQIVDWGSLVQRDFFYISNRIAVSELLKGGSVKLMLFSRSIFPPDSKNAENVKLDDSINFERESGQLDVKDPNQRIEGLRQALRLKSSFEFLRFTFPSENLKKEWPKQKLLTPFHEGLERVKPSSLRESVMLTLIEDVPVLVVKTSCQTVLFFAQKEDILIESLDRSDELDGMWCCSYVKWNENELEVKEVGCIPAHVSNSRIIPELFNGKNVALTLSPTKGENYQSEIQLDGIQPERKGCFEMATDIYTYCIASFSSFVYG